MPISKAFLFVILTFASTSFASQVFDLKFRIKASADDEVSFPKGGPFSEWQDTYPFYSVIKVETRATAKVLGSMTVRFEFEKPVTIKIKKDGKVGDREYSFVDVRFPPKDFAAFNKLRLWPDGVFLVHNGRKDSPVSTIESVIDYAAEAPSLQPLADMNWDLPMLLTPGSEIVLSEAPFADFENQRMTASILSFVLLRVVGFDGITTSTDRMYSSEIEDFMNKPNLNGYSEKARHFLKVQKAVRDIVWNMWAPVVQALNDSPFFHVPSSPIATNIESPGFGSKCDHDLSDEKSSIWSLPGIRKWLQKFKSK